MAEDEQKERNWFYSININCNSTIFYFLIIKNGWIILIKQSQTPLEHISFSSYIT